MSFSDYFNPGFYLDAIKGSLFSFVINFLASKQLRLAGFIVGMIGIGLLAAGLLTALGPVGISFNAFCCLVGGGALLAMLGWAVYFSKFFGSNANENDPSTEFEAQNVELGFELQFSTAVSPS